MIFSSLKKNEDFRTIYNRGKSFANRQLVFYYMPNKLSENRIGFSISKKFGKAVYRNKARRRLKEILRASSCKKQGYDMIFIVRPGAKEADYATLEKSVTHLFQKTEMI